MGSQKRSLVELGFRLSRIQLSEKHAKPIDLDRDRRGSGYTVNPTETQTQCEAPPHPQCVPLTNFRLQHLAGDASSAVFARHC